MAKVSFASKDASAGGIGVQEGPVEVMQAEVRVHQFPPNRETGEQGDPAPFVVLSFARLDPTSGERLDEDAIEEMFGIGKLEKFHPGNASSADDDDPEDAGDELDTTGNCIYAVTDGARLNKNCKWIRMSTSLEEQGFKPEVLGNGFMPDLVGLKMVVKTVTLPKMANSTSKREPTALICEKVIQFPYEKKAKGAAGKAAPAAKPAPGKAAPAAAKPAAKPAAAAEESSDDMAVTILKAIVEANSGKELELRKIVNAAQVRLMREKVAPKNHKPILDQLKDLAWLAEQAEALESFAVDAEGGTIVIS